MIAVVWMGLTLLLAVTLDGCSNQPDKSGRPEEPLTLEAPDEVEAGQTVNLKPIWRNLTDKAVKLTLEGRPPFDLDP